MVRASPPSRHHLAGGGAPRQSPAAPLTFIGPDKIGLSGSRNRTVRFLLFQAGASGSCLIRVATHFGDSGGVSTTSSMPSMKGVNSGHNESNLDKGNILKPTFDTLTEEGHKAFDAYHANLEELFLSCCEVTRQGIVSRIPHRLSSPSPRYDLTHRLLSMMFKILLILC
jgi:hypothetical protein